MICVPFNSVHVKILIAPCHMSVDDNCIDPPCSGLSKGTVLITDNQRLLLVRISKFDCLTGVIPIRLDRAMHKIGSAKCANK